ncbi:Acid sphingomyelinase-like phosphodiesterase 3b [Ascosphaera aggregata]|nr:Acid sphingomyelinase-like phosphodiesterase 3b [Ascosphaera aggregata]
MSRNILLGLLSAVLLGLVYADLQIPLVPEGGTTGYRIDDHDDGLVASAPPASSTRKLRGRFLHVTDVHIDPNYRPGTKASQSCHRQNGRGGVLGYPGTRCDSPLLLLDATFDWIKNNLVDDIDFIVWTGDASRHDNDESFPRSVDEVLNQNELVVDHVLDFFTHPNTSSSDGDDGDGHPPAGRMKIPFVPIFGNNDFMPHNVFKPGPNCWTEAFARVWRRFIPDDQRQSFLEGGWYYVETIPNKLAVFSLNTMYFFDRNTATNGCYDPKEPGYKHFEWLRDQLQEMRDRGMKVILLGHVPPAYAGNKMNWLEGCWQKYALWLRQYRDIIVGSMFGHMNLDHFILQDFDNITIDDGEAMGIDVVGGDDDDEEDEGEDDNVQISAAMRIAGQKYTNPDQLILNSKGRAKYLDQLRKQWYDLPEVSVEEASANSSPGRIQKQKQKKKEKKKKKKKQKQIEEIGGEFGERYAVSLVSPSVIPNYYPTIRVIEYNISGLEDAQVWQDNTALQGDDQPVGRECDMRQYFSDVDSETKKGKRRKKEKGEEAEEEKDPIPPFNVPKGPSESDSPGPAYSNQPLTWLSYTQYYSNITKIEEEANDGFGTDKKGDKRRKKEERKEGNDDDDDGDGEHDTYPSNFKYEVLYNTKTDKVYSMKDMTVKSYLELAKKIGKGYRKEKKWKKGNAADGAGKAQMTKNKKNKVWRTFISRAFVNMYEVDDIEGMMWSKKKPGKK